MCGIVGVAGKIWKQEEDTFKSLLELDTIRGPHSTGVIGINTNDWEYVKVVGTPWELYGAKGFDGLMRRWHRGLIGHNRWATVGKITKDNAHPFHHGDFVGVHNGTLRSLSNLPGHKKFETDSEMIYHSFSQDGVEATLKKLNGAFALAWYNNDDNSIQLCRNEERPLWLCRTKEGKTCFFASEPWMLRVALNRHGVEGADPIQIEPGVLVTLPLSQRNDDPILPHVRKVSLYVKPPEKPIMEYYTAPSLPKPSEKPAQGGGNTVVPFRPKEGQAPSLREYSGKNVTFSVNGMMKANSMEYISCSVEFPPTGSCDVEVRVFISPETKVGKWLLESTNYFRAKVKKTTDDSKYGRYLTIDARSLVEVKPPVEVKEETDKLMKHIMEESAGDEATVGEDRLAVYGGREVAAEEWFRQTADGCGWCSAPAKPSENPDYHWFAPGQYICKACKQDPEVAQMFQT